MLSLVRKRLASVPSIPRFLLLFLLLRPLTPVHLLEIQELGEKASLSEIVNWIRGPGEWYRWSDESG